jgi:uncharacterized protein (DUF2147 family)
MTLSEVGAMKRSALEVLVLALSCVGSGLPATSAAAETVAPCDSTRIVGEWLTPDGDLVVDVQKSGDTYSGTIVRLSADFWQNPERAKHRDDPGARARIEELIGTELLSELRCDDGQWFKGTIYVPHKDRRLECTIKVGDDDQTMDLTARARFMKRTKTWTRVEEEGDSES